jgi:hypothetical protein
VAGRRFVSLSVRAEHATAAVGHLGHLLAQDKTFYDLRRPGSLLAETLYRPALGDRAIDALASVGTPASQRQLLNYASRPGAPLESRRAAAAAFDRSVKRHGVLLTTNEIRHQYDLYNASEMADIESQQVFGQLLDSLESRREKDI